MTENMEIRAVWSSPTRKAGTTRYQITARTLDGSRTLSLSTVNDLKASLCQRAKDLGVVADVTYAPGTVFDDELIAIHLLPEKVQAA